MYRSSCSSASLSSSGVSLSRSAHVFLTMAAPPLGVDSETIVVSNLHQAKMRRSHRLGLGRPTIESVDLIKVDLGVEKGLNGGGDVVGVVVLGVTVATIAMVMMMMPRHYGQRLEGESGGSQVQWYLKP